MEEALELGLTPLLQELFLFYFCAEKLYFSGFSVCLINQNKTRSYVLGGTKGREQINGIFLMWLVMTCACHCYSLFI